MNAVILDNWTFQSLGELFAHGRSRHRVQALVVKGKQHAYEPMLEGKLQLKTLSDLLTNVILRDELLMDAGFLSAWKEYEGVFAPVLKAGMIKPTDPPLLGSAVAKGTEFIVKELCVTTSLKRIQTANAKHYAVHGTSKYLYQSQVVWGTAGMLSRSNVYQAPYVGHPLRQRFLESTGVFNGQGDVVRDVVELVNEKRAAIYAGSTPGLDLMFAHLTIPAVAVPVIMQANCVADLLQIAVDERDKHKKLRAWFTTFRYALSEGNTAGVAKHRKELNLLTRDVDRLVGKSSGPSFNFGISLSGPSASFPVGEWIRSLIGRYSIRHDLMKQVKVPGNAQANTKLHKLFKSSN